MLEIADVLLSARAEISTEGKLRPARLGESANRFASGAASPCYFASEATTSVALESLRALLTRRSSYG
jgi:hypothetical protein